MIKKSTCVVVLVYGVLLLALGGYGYCRSGSAISLIMGSGFGVLLMVSSAFMFAKKTWAGAAATALTFIVTATFAVRYAITSKTNPALLAVLSGGVLLFLLARIANRKRGDR